MSQPESQRYTPSSGTWSSFSGTGNTKTEVNVDVIVDSNIILSGAFPVEPSGVLHKAPLER